MVLFHNHQIRLSIRTRMEPIKANDTHWKHMNVNQEILVFKGAFYELAPLAIPLTLWVFIQNSVILYNYYSERRKLIARLFMGIAIADILKAQGELVLAIVSILVFKYHFNISVLYNSLYYYMVTALPGINGSKIFTFALSVLTTLTMVNPFRSIKQDKAQKIIAAAVISVITLHLLDTIIAVIAHSKFSTGPDMSFASSMSFLWLLAIFDFPGVVSVVGFFCYESRSSLNKSRCAHIGTPGALTHGQVDILAITAGAFYFVIPSIVFLVFMVIQIKYIRKSFQNVDRDSDLHSLPNPTRHISVTVLLVYVLFFMCHMAYFTICVAWVGIHPNYDEDGDNENNTFFVRMGVLLGFAKFTLPLIHAGVYPVIIITRKQDLRQRYMQLLRRLIPRCTSRAASSTLDVTLLE